tara:strand:+ start:182 stop:634 length:453 start_codon:yes stop_codon:yes gene_type:complete
MGISGCWWKEIKGLERASKNVCNKGKIANDKIGGDKVYTQCALNSKPEPLGTAIAIARNMPTFELGEDMDEGQRLKMIEDYIKKNGATQCGPGESGNGNAGLSPWSRIKLTDDGGELHPLDGQKKVGRGHKNKKIKKNKRVNKVKRGSSN